MLAEAIEPRLSGDEFFQRFIIDGAFQRRASAGRVERLELTRGGWLLTAPSLRGPLRDLVTARVRAAGFADMADYLDERSQYAPREEGSGTLSQISFLVGGCERAPALLAIAHSRYISSGARRCG